MTGPLYGPRYRMGICCIEGGLTVGKIRRSALPWMLPPVLVQCSDVGNAI